MHSPDPVAQGAFADLHAFPSIDLRLPIQGKMVLVLRGHDVRKQRRTRIAAGNGATYRRCLHHAITTGTGKARSNVTHDVEADANEFQHLADLFTQPLPSTATVGPLCVVRQMSL